MSEQDVYPCPLYGCAEETCAENASFPSYMLFYWPGGPNPEWDGSDDLPEGFYCQPCLESILHLDRNQFNNSLKEAFEAEKRVQDTRDLFGDGPEETHLHFHNINGDEYWVPISFFLNAPKAFKLNRDDAGVIQSVTSLLGDNQTYSVIKITNGVPK